MMIGLTGPARSGKDTVAHYLVSEYRFKHFDFYGDVLLKELAKKKLKPTKDNASKVGDTLRAKKGRGVMAEMLFPKIDAEDAVITGFRSPEEVEFFRKKTTKFFLIMVEAPKETRFGRRDSSDKAKKEAFFERDERDLQNKGMESVFLMANHVVQNDGTLKALKERVDVVMDEIAGDKE
jgi:dephospho-CoA kinase